MKKKENEYIKSILEDTSSTGGPSGAVGSSSIGIGGGGVAYGNASTSGMGPVISSQPSVNAGVTTEPGYSYGGGSIGSGDISVPYNTGPKGVFQKIRIDDRKGTNKRRKNKMIGQIKSSLIKRQDFTRNSERRVMDFDSFFKFDMNRIKK